MHIVDAGLVQNLFNTIGTVGIASLITAFGLCYFSSIADKATSWGGNKKWW